MNKCEACEYPSRKLNKIEIESGNDQKGEMQNPTCKKHHDVCQSKTGDVAARGRSMFPLCEDDDEDERVSDDADNDDGE